MAGNTRYWYRVVANGATVGDVSMPPFPTMSADSVSGTVEVQVGTPATAPADPTNLTATLLSAPARVSLVWRDNATNETGFLVQRCSFVAPATTCGNFATIATPGPRNNTGNVTYVDATVTAGNSYLYQVAATNATATSAFVTLAAAVVVPAIPAAPTNFIVSAVDNPSGPNWTATLSWAAAADPASFTIQRATNATFTTGLSTFTPPGTARGLTQTVNATTTYYYRIRANNSAGGSSAWANALPFPIRTGPR